MLQIVQGVMQKEISEARPLTRLPAHPQFSQALLIRVAAFVPYIITCVLQAFTAVMLDSQQALASLRSSTTVFAACCAGQQA